MVKFLSNEDLQNLLSWSETVATCENLLLERSHGTAWFSPRERFVLPSGRTMLVLPGGAVEANFVGARIYTSWPPGSVREIPRGKHTLKAASVNFVYDMKSVEMLAITAGEWINTLRTTGIAAVGAKYLARKDSKRIGVFGSGFLAMGALMTLKEVFHIDSAKVFSRNPEHRASFCSKLSSMMGVPVEPTTSPNEVLTESDIVVTATDSTEPVFDGRLLNKGVHVNCIGGYVQGGGRELDENAMARFDTLAVLNKDHAIKGGVWDDKPNQNFKIAIEKSLISWDNVVEISDIIGGRSKGRQSDDDITLFDNRGMGAFDVALSYRAYQLAKERGIGMELEWGKRPEPGWS